MSKMIRPNVSGGAGGERWHDNTVQFPRLLAEIVATQDLDIDALCVSMDLSPREVNELFERAQGCWELEKAII